MSEGFGFNWRAASKQIARVGLLSAALVLFAGTGGSMSAAERTATQIAALALPTGPQADWRQWDAFLTNVIKKLGADFPPEWRDRLAEIFLDARYQLTSALSSGASDPVPQLFTDAWNSLSPLLKQAVPVASQQNASQYTNFILAMDAAKSLGDIGQSLGIFRITPEALAAAAGLLGAGGSDPLSYVMEIDAGLRSLLGFTEPLPAWRPSSRLEQGRLEQLRDKASAAIRLFFFKHAHAAESDFDRLNEWLPDTPEIEDYLIEVRKLLVETSDRVLAKSPLASRAAAALPANCLYHRLAGKLLEAIYQKRRKINAARVEHRRRRLDASESDYLAQYLRCQGA